MCIHWKFQPDPEGDFSIASRPVERLPPRDHFQRQPSTRQVSTELRSPKFSTYHSSHDTVLTVERKPKSSHSKQNSTSSRSPRLSGRTTSLRSPRGSSHSIPAPAPLVSIPNPNAALPIPAGEKPRWVRPDDVPPPVPSPPGSSVSGDSENMSDDEYSSAVAGGGPSHHLRGASTAASSVSPQPSEYKSGQKSSGPGHSRKESRDSRRSVVVDQASKRDSSRLAIKEEDKPKRMAEERIINGEDGRRRKQYHYR